MPGRLDMAERRERYSRRGKKEPTSETFRGQQQVVKHTETTAWELLSEAQAGNGSAFERLVERHRDDVYGLALQMTRSEICALNIAQKSFLSACLHLNEFQTEAEFGAWVRQMAAEFTMLQLPRRAPRTVEDEVKSRALN